LDHTPPGVEVPTIKSYGSKTPRKKAALLLSTPSGIASLSDAGHPRFHRRFTDNPQGLVLKRLAKYWALHCFRNSQLENLHAAQKPITDLEMRRLMIEVVNRCYSFLMAMTDQLPAK